MSQFKSKKQTRKARRAARAQGRIQQPELAAQQEAVLATWDERLKNSKNFIKNSLNNSKISPVSSGNLTKQEKNGEEGTRLIRADLIRIGVIIALFLGLLIAGSQIDAKNQFLSKLSVKLVEALHIKI